MRNPTSLAHIAGDHVGLKPRAVDDAQRRDAALVGVDVHCVAAPGDVLYAGVQPELSTQLPEVGRVGSAHATVVDDARLRRPDGLDPSGVRLDLPETLAANEFEPLHTVGLAACEQVM